MYSLARTGVDSKNGGKSMGQTKLEEPRQLVEKKSSNVCVCVQCKQLSGTAGVPFLASS